MCLLNFLFVKSWEDFLMRYLVVLSVLLLAFQVNADNGDEAEAAPAKATTPAKVEKPASSDDDGDSFGFDGLLISNWNEMGIGNNGGTNGYNYTLIRPYFSILGGKAKLHLAFELETGSPVSSTNSVTTTQDGDAVVGSEYAFGDPYLMLSGKLLSLGDADVSGYLRYYIPISPGSRANERYSYLRGVLSIGYTTSAGVKIGISNEIRNYLYADNTDQTTFRWRPYLALGGNLGPFPFYSNHGVGYYNLPRGQGVNEGTLFYYNETIIYTKVGKTPYMVGLGLIQDAGSRRVGSEEGIAFYHPAHSRWVVELVGSF